MDSALKQDAIVAEVTQGTTPASPAFKLLRVVSISGAPSRPNVRTPERRADRMAGNMVRGLNSYSGKRIEMVWQRDDGTDILWESLFCNTFSTNVLKNASTKRFFTLEEKYEGGVTDPYRRLLGCMVNEASISWRNGEPGTVSFGLMALSETAATTAIASSTYAAATPGNDPVTPADIVVNDCFSVSGARLAGLNLTISNSEREQYGFGSADPFGIGLGAFNVQGTVELYYNAAADYSTFMTKQSGLILDLTIGSVTNFKDRLQLLECDVWNPNVSDPGNSGDHMVTLEFMGRIDVSDNSAIKLTRNVA